MTGTPLGGPYQPAFAVGERVRIRTSEELHAFRATWRWHDPLEDAMLECTDRVVVVAERGFYHGGDVLYTLVDVPGIWHEACLAPS